MKTPPLSQELADLLELYCLGELSADQARRLEELVTADASQREHFLRFVMMHAAALRYEAQRPEAIADARCSLPAGVQCSPATSSGFKRIGRPAFWAAVAAGLLFAAYFVGISWDMLGRREAGDFGLQAWGDAASEPVAAITETSEVEWSEATATRLTAARRAGLMDVRGQTLPPGAPLQLVSGLVEMQLNQGAKLVIQGPAEWTIDARNLATLKRGKLVAHVPRQAAGFAVQTPTAKIVDLGTEFGVEVTDNGKTEVHVIRGSVDIYTEGTQTKNPGEPEAARKGQVARLSAGQAACAEPGSTSTTAVEFQAGRFAIAQEVRKPRSRTGPTRMVDLSKAAAEQSSTWSEVRGDFSASAALDGVAESVSHTTGDAPGQWWQVDLGQTSGVVAVELKNRPIRCGWLRDIRVKILGEDGKTVLYESELLNPNNEAYGGAKEFERGPAQLMLDVQRTHGKAVPGRFVRLERVECEATVEQAPQDIRPAVIAAAGRAIVLSEVNVFVERE